jgi:ABC-type dipeptide/oligopeptide/nickel transport system ATPase component
VTKVSEEREVILDVKDLELWFDNDYNESVKIINKINFQIHKGETLGIVGESGCGKSMTSLSIMCLVKTPPARIDGQICFRGENLLDLPVYTAEAKEPPAWNEFGWDDPAPQLASFEVFADSCTVEAFAQKVSGQHVIVAYGNHVEAIRDFCQMMDIELVM